MVKLNSFGGRTVLGVGFVAGMVDLVALPLWIGALMGFYSFSPVHAGITVTAFLLGVVAASAVISPLFERLPHKAVVAAGFVVGAASFAAILRFPANPASFVPLSLLHAVAGMGAGCALSVILGTIGRTENPHRLFGVVNVALGVFGVLFFAAVPPLMAKAGGQAIFVVFACAMTLAAAIALIGFPAVEGNAAARLETASRGATPMPKTVWLVIFVVICLAFNQSMMFSFVERIGNARGFSAEAVGATLVVLGFINLLPGGLAALLQSRLSPIVVGIGGPVAQAVLALIIVNATTFTPYAVAVAPYVCAIIFTHTFLFGLLSRLDTSGRAVAGTPAMMMAGSATGPAVGGAIVAAFGYEGLGWMATLVACVAVSLMLVLRSRIATQDLQPQAFSNDVPATASKA